MNGFGNRFFNIRQLLVLSFLLAEAAFGVSGIFALSERPVFTSYSIQDGLPHSSVRCIYQDSYGFIWLGTGSGLSRFDGLNFKNYMFNIADPNSIPESTINTICEDTINNMHVLMIGFGNGGMAIYNYDKDNFVMPPSLHVFSNTSVFRILEDKIQNQLFVFCTSGLFHLRNKDELFNADCIFDQLLPNNNLVDLFLDHQSLFAFNEREIYLFPDITKSSITDNLRQISLITEEGKEITNLQCILHLKNSFILGSSTGLYRYNIEREKLTEIEFTILNYGQSIEIVDINYQTVLEDHRGEIWFGTASMGLLRSRDMDLTTLEVISSQHSLKSSLQSDYIMYLYEDNLNNLWVGTYKGGVSVSNLNENKLRFYSPESINNKPKKTVFCVLPVFENKVIYGTNQGGLKFADLSKNNIPEELIVSKSEDDFIRQGIFTSVLHDSKQRLWVCTSNSGLFCIKDVSDKELMNFSSDLISKKKVSHFTPESQPVNAIKGWSARKVYEDRYGNIWIGTLDGGLNRFVEKNEEFRYYDLIGKTGISDYNRFRNIYESETGWDSVFFVCTAGGLVILHADDRKLYIGKSQGLNDDKVWSTAQDKEGKFWVGTSKGGINIVSILNREGKNANIFGEIDKIDVSYVNVADGLPDHTIYTLTSLEKGIWFSTEGGLGYYRYKDQEYYKFNKFGDLVINEFNFGAKAYQPETNTLYFGTSSGIVYFNPDSIMIDSAFKPVYITDLNILNKTILPGDSINNRVVLDRSIINTQKIDIFHADRVFTLTFISPDFSNAKDIAYKYKLEGFDTYWNLVSANRNTASYSNLPSNEYIFKVKASNQYGGWPEEYTELKIIVHPAWWRTTLAKLLYVFIIGGSIMFLYHIRIRRERYENQLTLDRIELENQKEIAKKANEINTMKIKFFMNISHEFRTPLTLIQGPVSSLINRIEKNIDKEFLKNQLFLIQNNTSRLLRLINQLLDFRKLEMATYKLNVSRTDIADLVKEYYRSFEYMALRHSIKYNFRTTQDTYEGFVDRDILEKVMYNLLSNAFKYTPDHGEIVVSMETYNNTFIQVNITDTGTGIEPEKLPFIFDRFYQASGSIRNQSGTGIGLSLVKELIELHKGVVLAESRENEGSKFIIRFPVDENSYTNEEKVDNIAFAISDIERYPHITNNTIDFTQNEGIISSEEESNDELKHILIVDDNPDLLYFLETELSGKYKISTAKNGMEGIEIAIRRVPDFIISDVMMPELDGFELTKRIKNNRLTSHIPVILLTARNSDEDQISGLMEGADDYIAKPFDADALLLKIGNILNTRESLKQNFKKRDIKPKDIAVSSVDEQFLDTLFRIVEEKMEDPELNVEFLASELNMSRSMLFKKLKALTGETGSSFLNTMRMKRAAQLITSGQVRISEVAYRVGYSDPLYFSKNFKKYFGVPPSSYNQSD